MRDSDDAQPNHHDLAQVLDGGRGGAQPCEAQVYLWSKYRGRWVFREAAPKGRNGMPGRRRLVDLAVDRCRGYREKIESRAISLVHVRWDLPYRGGSLRARVARSAIVANVFNRFIYTRLSLTGRIDVHDNSAILRRLFHAFYSNSND